MGFLLHIASRHFGRSHSKVTVFHQTWRQLGIERSRIYQLIGPDPIAAERRTANHNVEPENVQSLHIAQLTNVEQPARPQLPAPDREQSATGASDQPTEQTAVVQPTAVSIAAIAEAQDQPVRTTPQITLRDLPFAEALVQFSTWYSTLTPDQQLQVERAMGDVEAIEQTAVREPEEAAAD